MRTTDEFVFPDLFVDDSPTEFVVSQLFAIEPRDLGQPTCESLRSYFLRLSDAHRLSPTDVLRFLLEHSEMAPFGSNPMGVTHCMTNKARNIFFSNLQVTRALVSVLSTATGVTALWRCTAIPLNGAISPGNLFSKQERHCPVCVQDGGVQTHGRLAWEFRDVTVCAEHRVALVTRKCHAPEKQRLLPAHQKKLPGVCPSCGSIGFQCTHRLHRQATPQELWIAQQVGELIAYNPVDTATFSREGTTAKGVRSIFSLAGQSRPAPLARRAGIPKSIVWGWMNGHHLPELGGVLALCMAAKVSLVSVLNGCAEPCDAPEPVLRKSTGHSPRTSRCERETALQEALEQKSPPSLRSVASKLGLKDAKTLRQQFPELSKRVVDRNSQFRAAENKRLWEEALVEAEQLIQKLIAERRPITVRNLGAARGKPLGQRSRVGRAASEILPHFLQPGFTKKS